MLLQILAACPAPGPAAMDDALAHVFEDRLSSRERFVRAAAHEGQRARRRPADPAGDGRVEGEHARRGAGFMRLLRALDVDGRAIDDERALWRRGKKIRMRRENMPARRQHGYDRIGAGDRLAGGSRNGTPEAAAAVFAASTRSKPSTRGQP